MWVPGVLLLVSNIARTLAAALHDQIPAVDAYTPGSDASSFHMTPQTQIVVDVSSAHVGTPSLLDFAHTFRTDLLEIMDFASLPSIKVADTSNLKGNTPTIALRTQATDHVLFSGKSTDEGYDLDIVNPFLVIISGAQPIGAWWGTRTLLQQTIAAKANGLPMGGIRDSPGWPVRGFMLDAGRHWYETSFLADLCAYASFFKLNEFHIHASDNLWDPNFLYGPGDAWKELYTGFRLRPPPGSSLSGLVPLVNESWTRTDFEDMQTKCAARGVGVVLEIDTPGHSLAISKWKPELRIIGEPDDLNLSHPDTVPTIKAIWDEFLPWVSSSEVSIGADEYDTAYADAYLDFVNEMSSYIHSTSDKSIRVWGTSEPSTTRALSTNITIQHWDFPDGSIPVQLMHAGYDVINSEQTFLYLDGKTSDDGQFPQTLNESLLWESGWAPNVFTTSDPSNNTAPTNPRLRGSIMALWNDWGNNATTALEAYYALARSLPLLAEKAWNGAGVRPGALSQARFDAAYPALNAEAPGQNLNRAVTPRFPGGVVFEYDLTHTPPGAVVQTGIDSVGPPYTLSFEVMDDPHAPGSATLFTGADSALRAGSLAFVATGQAYPLKLTLPTDRFASVVIRATRAWTQAEVDGRVFWFTTTMDIWGEYMAIGNMSFAAPAATIGQAKSGVQFGKVMLKLGI